MLGFLRGIFDGEVRSARRIASRFLESRRAPVRAWGAQLRAKEPTRIVIAVQYEEPNTISRPPPYQLVAVDRASGEATFLETTPDSPYWIRGRK